MDLVHNSEFVKNVLTSLAIVVGGSWTFWRFILQREGHPKIQFNIDLRLIGTTGNWHLVEVVAIIENKGKVRHYIHDFNFRLLYLGDGDDLTEGGKKINNQIEFKELAERRSWLPPKWNYTFIDEGVVQNYCYVTRLPCDAKFVLINGQFKYPRFRVFVPFGYDFHTAQKTFSIPDTVQTKLTIK